jgi:hypothetical protein
MSRFLRLTPLLLVLALLWGGEAAAQRQWPNDVSGRPAPPCTVYDPIANTTSFCSTSNPLPVGAPGGGSTGLGTTGGTSVTGFGKAWYPSTYQAGGEPTAAVFQDGATVNAFRRNTGCGNCLTVATSTDGGINFVEVNTSFIVGNTVQFIIKVPSSPARYLGYTPNGASSHIYNSTSIQSGWADGVTASPDLNNGIVDVATNTTGSVVLMVGGVGGGNHTNVCKSTDQGRNFGSCVNVRAAVAASGIWYGGGTIWFASSQDGGISRSTDDGATWTLVQTLGGNGGHGLCTAFTSFATCLNLTGGSVFRSTDNGLTWINIAGGVGSLICDYGAGNIGIFPGTPPVGFAAITNTSFSSQDSGLNFYAGSIFGSAWTGVGAPSATVFVCNTTGRGFAGIHTTAGPTPQFNFYNPVTQPGGTLQSSAGGYSVAALIQSGVIQNAAPTTSAANTAATGTLTGTAGSRICVREIDLFSSAAGAATLTISDGATVVQNFGTITTGTAATRIAGSPVLCGQTGNNVVVNIGAAGVGITTTTSVIADRYPN